MADNEAWEWVYGDPVRATRFAALYVACGVVIAVAAADGALGIMAAAGVAPVSWALPVPSSMLLVLGSISALWLVLLLPRWVAVVSRLGISPSGVRLAAPFGGRFARPWTSVRAVTPDSILFAGGVSYRLTLWQAVRLHEFVSKSGALSGD